MLSQEISQELQDIPRKCPFLLQSYKILQDNKGFCKNLARNCVDRFLQDSCKIPKVLGRSCWNTREKDLFLQFLQCFLQEH